MLAAEAFLRLLAARGVDYLFANGGTDFAPVAEAWAKGRAEGAPLQRHLDLPLGGVHLLVVRLDLVVAATGRQQQRYQQGQGSAPHRRLLGQWFGGSGFTTSSDCEMMQGGLSALGSRLSALGRAAVAESRGPRAESFYPATGVARSRCATSRSIPAR